jgi:hypothetical protein
MDLQLYVEKELKSMGISESGQRANELRALNLIKRLVINTTVIHFLLLK